MIHRRGPWKAKESVKRATQKPAPEFDHHWLLEPIGYMPPAEAGANDRMRFSSQNAEAAVLTPTQDSPRVPG